MVRPHNLGCFVKLHLGVEVEHPDYYSSGHPSYTPNHKSTADVANELEKQYGIMQVFFDEHKQQIADTIANALLQGINGVHSDHYQLESIERDFRLDVIQKQFDGKTKKPSPTKASLMGVSSRRKRATGVPRPSFLDGGEYMGSFRAWVE